MIDIIYLKGLLKNKFLQNVTTLMSGTAIAQLLSFLLLPILTRLYSQEAFGILASFTAITSVIASFATLKYDTAIVLPKEDKSAYALLKLSNRLAISLIVFSGIALYLPIPYFKEYDGLEILIAIGAILMVNFNISELWNIRNKKFKITAIGKVIQKLGVFLFQFILYYFFEIKGLVIGNIIGVLISGLYLIIIRYKSVDKSVKSVKKDEIIKAAKRYVKFPKYFAGSNLILSLTEHLPTLLFVKYISTALLGAYGVALKVIAQPVLLISRNVRSVVLSYMSERKNNNLPILKWYLKIILLLFSVSMLGCIIVLWKGETILTIFLGKSWSQTGVLVKNMLPMFVGKMIDTPATAAVRVFEMQKYTLIYSIVSLGIRLLTLSLLFYLDFNFEFLIFIYSFIVLFIIIANNSIVIKKILNYEKLLKS